MTNMEKVAEMLGVKIGEKFNIKGDLYNPHEITSNGLVDTAGDLTGDGLNELLTGDLIIEKIEQEPKNVKVTKFLMASIMPVLGLSIIFPKIFDVLGLTFGLSLPSCDSIVSNF